MFLLGQVKEWFVFVNTNVLFLSAMIRKANEPTTYASEDIRRHFFRQAIDEHVRALPVVLSTSAYLKPQLPRQVL
jgi:hypothetical protein